MEGLELRMLMAADLDDSLSESVLLGAASPTPITISDSISPDTDVDIFRFTVTAGQVVDFDIDTTLNGTGGLGSYIRLFNSQGTQLAFNDDANAPGENVVGFDAYLRYTFATAGTYYLGVSNYNNASYDPVSGNGDVAGGSHSTGTYQLTMKGLPVDTDDTLVEAASLGGITTTAITTSASIDPDIDVDMYKFTVTAGQVIDFDIDTTANGPGGLGSYLRLFNSQGTQIAFNDDAAAPDENGVGFDAYLRYTFPAAGTFYVGVSNNNNTTYDAVSGNSDTAGGLHSIGAYQLIVQAIVAAPNDPDDAINEAIALGAATTTGTSTNNTISPDVDVDMYSFSVTAGQVVDFDIDTTLNGGGGLGSYIRLFNSSGTQLAFNNDGAAPGENTVGFDAYLRYTFAAAGTYYLGVSNANNTIYNAVNGNNDVSGGTNSTGTFQLTIKALPIDTDDALVEATVLGGITTTAITTSASIDPDIDVDMYKFTVTAGQVIDFDIDTTLNGPGGLGSYIRLFNSQGTPIAFNDDAAAPDDNGVGFDAYLRHTFTAAGTFYVGVSNANNTTYDAVTGNSDTAGGLHSIGAYQLIVQAIVAAPNDPDDAINEAIALGAANTTGISTNNTISPDVDVDMYSFSVTAGQVVDFDIDTTLNGGGGLGSYIRLFNSTGTELAFNNDGAAPGENTVGFDAYLRYTFAAAGTYYLGVSNANNTSYNAVNGTNDVSGGSNSTGTFQLTIKALPIDTDDAIAEATVLGAITTTAITTSGSIDPDIDVDMYRFTVTAGQVIDFDIDTVTNGPGGLGSYIRLFNSQGTQIAFNDDAAAPGENGVGFDAYLRYTFAGAGTFYVGVSNANNISYDASTGNSDMAGGLHSIGAYQLVVQEYVVPPVDPDDAISEAVSLGALTTVPTTKSNSISPEVDVDMFSFTVTAGQVVDFDIDTALNGSGGLGSYLRLFTLQGLELASNNDGAAPGENTVGFDAYLRYKFNTAGTYYVGVSNSNNTTYDAITGNNDAAGGANATGNYQLTVAVLPVDPDDTLVEAPTIGAITTTPVTVSGNVDPDIDVDVVKFTVTAGQVVDFDIDTTLNGPGGLGSYIRLFDSQGTQLAFNDDAAAPGENVTGFDAYLRYTFSAAGTYYLGVSNFNNAAYNPVTGEGDTAGGLNSIGAYQLIVQAFVAPPGDSDDAISEAISLGAITVTPVTSSNSISPDTDVDMFGFTVTAGQVVDFDIDTSLNGGTGLGSYIRLFNAQGTQLASNNDAAAPGENTVGFDAYLRYTFTTAGTYYLGVSNLHNITYNPATGGGDVAGGANSTGAYQLTVQALPIDLDDALVEAKMLGAITSTAISNSASIDPDIDVDMFGFTVTAGQVVDFDIDTAINGPGGLGSYIRLFNAQGTQIALNDNGAANGELLGLDSFLRYTFATAGTYYLGVSNHNNVAYDAVTGDGDTAGGLYSIGSYELTVQMFVPPPPDTDDAISEAIVLGAVTTAPTTTNGTISLDLDVDMFSFTVTTGQVVDFDIDTPLNGAGGLGSYIRLFNAAGTQLLFDDDAAAPGENNVGFDAYLRYTFASAGTYYLGVSNNTNIFYDPLTGDEDAYGGANSTGNYDLTIRALPVDTDDSLSEAKSVGAVSATVTTINDLMDTDIDVDLVKFTVAAGQTVDFDIDTPFNGTGGLGSYIRLFDSQGAQLDFNNDAAAPGESVVGVDAYLRYTFTSAGTYYLGVSNFNNVTYDPATGNGDTAGGKDSIGDYQLNIQLIVGTPTDSDDAINEASDLGEITTAAVSASKSISPDVDVDMFRFAVSAGQVVDFDIDTPLNGPGGLGSYIRLFDAQGNQLAINNDAAAPGEANTGLDSYLRYTFSTGGVYYLGVSNATNVAYSAVTGDGDAAGGSDATGAYLLTVQAIEIGAPSLSLTINPGKVSELGGTALGTLTRTNGDTTQSLTVSLTSSSTSDATVPSTVTLPANVLTVSFQVTGVHNTAQGTTMVVVSATAPGYAGTESSLLVTDRDQKWHNAASPMDVDSDGTISPLDILVVINYLNVYGAGDVPVGTAPPYMDVDGDNQITPLDVLVIINHLNESGSGEGEQAPALLQTQELSPSSVDAAHAELAQAVWLDLESTWNKAGARRRI